MERHAHPLKPCIRSYLKKSLLESASGRHAPDADGVQLAANTILRVENISIDRTKAGKFQDDETEYYPVKQGSIVKLWLSDGELMVRAAVSDEMQAKYDFVSDIDHSEAVQRPPASASHHVKVGTLVQVLNGQLRWAVKRNTDFSRAKQQQSDIEHVRVGQLAWIALRQMRIVNDGSNMPNDTIVHTKEYDVDEEIGDSGTEDESGGHSGDVANDVVQTSWGQSNDANAQTPSRGEVEASSQAQHLTTSVLHSKDEPSREKDEAGRRIKRVRIADSVPELAVVRESSTPPSSIRPITRKLRLYTLYELKHPRTRLPKNCSCDVLAVVCAVSPTATKTPFHVWKRDLRIVDSSMERLRQKDGGARGKKAPSIQLSVCVDAKTFAPPVGTVALFRNLKTHSWEGLSLNAYESECKGRQWFFTDPELTEQQAEFERERTWWEQRGRVWWEEQGGNYYRDEAIAGKSVESEETE